MRFKKAAAVLLAAALSAATLTGCANDQHAVVATLNNTQIELGLVNFMCRYEQAGMDDVYRQFFGDDVWQSDLYGSGATMEDSTKSEVMGHIHELYILAETDHMAEYGVELTAEDEAVITETAAAFMAANSKDTLDEMGATQENVEEMLRLYTIKSKMHEAIIADVDTAVTDEEANMRAYTFASTGIVSHLDSETGSSVEYTEEEVAELTAAMNELADEVENGEDLKTAAEALGITVQSNTYAADDNTLDPAVKEALDGLKEGEVSEVITTEDMLYLLLVDSDCDEEATAQHRDEIIAERQNEKYNEVLSAWSESAAWTTKESLLKNISFKNHLTQTLEAEEAGALEVGTEN